MIPVHLIVAADNNNGIGFEGSLPWFFQKELRYFSRVTTQTFSEKKTNAVIMGKNTWNSIPNKPLKNRVNIVISTTLEDERVDVVPTVANALFKCRSNNNIESIFIIGGVGIYKEIFDMNIWSKIFLTRIDGSFECDTCFPELENIEGTLSPVKSQQEKNMGDGKIYEYKHYVIDYASIES